MGFARPQPILQAPTATCPPSIRPATMARRQEEAAMVAAAMDPERGAAPGIPHFDFDPFGIEFFAASFAGHERLGEAGSVVYLDKWAVYGVARYEQVHAVLND